MTVVPDQNRGHIRLQYIRRYIHQRLQHFLEAQLNDILRGHGLSA